MTKMHMIVSTHSVAANCCDQWLAKVGDGGPIFQEFVLVHVRDF
jgi:hypothetical protein